jgi:hypothetical protein
MQRRQDFDERKGKIQRDASLKEGLQSLQFMRCSLHGKFVTTVESSNIQCKLEQDAAANVLVTSCNSSNLGRANGFMFHRDVQLRDDDFGV